MPSSEEVKLLEGVAVRQHRFRLSVPAANDGEPLSTGGMTGTIVPPSHRASRYKEKFHALREKYTRVTAQRATFESELDVANAKLAKLQAENDMLLDALCLAGNNPSSSLFGAFASSPKLESRELPPPTDVDASNRTNGKERAYGHNGHANHKQLVNGEHS